MTLRRTNPAAAAFIFLMLAIWLLPTSPVKGAESRKQVIFAPQASYSIEITNIDGNDYISLFEALEPLRKTDVQVDGKNWKLKIAGTPVLELRFRDKKRKFTLGSGTLELAADFRLVGGRGYVPLASLDWLLTQITGLNSEMHPATRRLFLGGVATRINAEVRRSPSRIVLTFPFAVNPDIASEGNTLKLVFSKEPVVSTGTENLNVSDPLFAAAGSSETIRGTEFVVRGNAPLNFALADSGRTVVISGPPTAASAAPATATMPSPAPSTTPKQPPPKVAATLQPERKTFVVVVDPAHGGGDSGAVLPDHVLEKDMTLGIARRLLQELQSRGIPAMLVRTGDTQLTAEQRAIIANSAALSRTYISIHVAAAGTGVKVYRAMLGTEAVPQLRGKFLPWQTAQTMWLDRSKELSAAIAAECSRRQMTARSSSIPLTTLNSIDGPAVAVEVAPPQDKIADVATAEFQHKIAAALANAIAALQPSAAKQGGMQ